MNGRIDTALLRAARLEFDERILPGPAGPERYVGAMRTRALDVLLAQAPSIADPDQVLEVSGIGAPGALAASLREGRQEDTSELRSALRGFVEETLRIRDPKLLDTTRRAAGAARS